MAQLLTGTRIYGTGTVDTQLFVSGTNSATSTTTGALQVVGGVGVGGNLYVGGTIFGSTISGTASTATNADNIKTVLQTLSASHYLTFVDANNSTAAYEALYTTSSFVINPQSGNIGIGNATPTWKVDANLGTITGPSISTGGYNVTGDATTSVGYTTYNMQLNNTTANASGYMRLARTASTVYLGMQIGSQSRDGIAFLTGATTPAESLRITAAGRVGIGTSAPLANLEVSSTASTTVKVTTSGGNTLFRGYEIGATTGDSGVYGSMKMEVNGGELRFTAGYASWGGYQTFLTNGSERLRITANGGISFGASGTAYGVSGQILQSNGDAAPTWISTGSLTAANATTATHLSGGTAGQVPYQTAPGVTSFYGPGTAGNVLVSNGTGAPTYNNTLTLTGTTAATSTTTGALQVVGGVGVGGDLFIRGDILTNDTTFNLINANAITVNFAGAATSLNVGATSGSTNVRNNLTVSGNLTVQGTTTIVDSTVTNIADPILTLGGGTGNTAPTADDNKDRGVAFKWVNNGGTTSTGFFGYDDSTGYFTYIQTATITNEVVSGTKGAMDVNLAGGSAMALVYQSSPNNTAFLAASTSGYILQTNGTGSPPTWVSASGVSAGSATYADNIRTIAQTASASYFPTFVDSNNASNAYESLYTTSSFVINPFSGLVTISGNSGDGVPILRVTGTSAPAAGFNWAGSFMNSSLTTGKNTVILIGQAESTKNSGYIGFNYAGTAGSNSSFMTIGLYANDNILNVTGAGNVGIGETAPNQKLIVAGAIKVTGGANLGTTNGTAGAELEYSYPNTRMFIGDGTGWGFRIAKRTTSVTTDLFSFNDSGALGFNGSFGSSGQLLQSNGAASPTWINASTVGAGSVNTVLQTASASYYLTFVDSNNASATAESLYTTSSFQINPSTGNIQIGMTGQDYQPSSGGNHTLRLNALNTSSIGFHDSGSTIGNLKFSGNYGFEIGAYDGLYGPHNTILHGSVGIGTNTPASLFHISGADPQTRLQYTGTSGNFETLINFVDFRGTVNAAIGNSLQDDGVGTAAAHFVIKTATAGSLTERVRITRNGGIAFGGAANYGSAGQMLRSNGDAAPTWVNQSTIASGQVRTIAQTASASYFPTFVDSNNASATAESVYTTSSFTINPGTGLLTVTKLAQIGTTVAQGDPSATDITANATLLLSGVGGNYLSFGQKASNLAQWIQSGYLNPTTAVYPISLNPLGGNVGIGTLTPSGKLHLYQTSGGSNILTLDTNFVNGNAFAINPFITGISNGGLSIRDVNNAVDRLVIQYSTGNVGINTTNPGYPLTVQTNGTSVSPTPQGSNIALRLQSTQTNYAVTLQFSDNLTNAASITMQGGGFRFTTANPGAVQSMNISSSGNVSIGTTSTTNKFEISGDSGQLFSVSDSFTGTIFSANDVSGIPSIEVLDTGLVKFAQYGGQVAINTGTVASSTASLSVYGMIYTMGTLGEIRASSEITAYYSSDQRLKENIKLIENPITIIDRIRGVTFDWTDEHMARRGGEDGYFVRKHDIGVIAQEVQAVLPELVGTREDGYLAVKYEKLVPLLIEAVKEQQKTIETLTSEIKEIKEFLSSLKNN